MPQENSTPSPENEKTPEASQPKPTPPADSSALDRTIDAVDANDSSSPDQEFYLPVHGFVWFSKAEMKIINHPAFQRLGDVNQLGQAHLVFRGATHKRMEHALGTVYVAQWMMDEIERNHSRLSKKAVGRDRPLCPTTFSPTEKAFIRLAALLHDIGHLPAGHTLEDELKLLNKHESVARLDTIFKRNNWSGGEYPTLEEVVNSAYAPYLRGLKVTPVALLYGLIAKKFQPPVLPIDFKLQVCRDLVGNTICADLLDYIHRDWYHIGKPMHIDSRLFQYMELRMDSNNQPALVISLGERSKMRTDAITAIVGLLESRYQLAESALFHRTKCALSAMLERGIQELRFDPAVKDRQQWDLDLERRFLDCSDASAVRYVLFEATKRKNPAAVRVLRALANREVYATVSTTFYQELEHHFPRLLEKYITPDSGTDDTERADRVRLNRLNAMRYLERDFDLPPGSMVMYFPARSMNAKIPEVKIHVDGQINTFEAWNETDPHKLDGGHLAAQIIRFQRLWRTHVSLIRTEFEKMPPAKLRLLKNAIELLVFDMCRSTMTPVEAALDLAERARSTPGMPWTGFPMPAAEVGRRYDPQEECYPFGAPTIAAIFSKTK